MSRSDRVISSSDWAASRSDRAASRSDRVASRSAAIASPCRRYSRARSSSSWRTAARADSAASAATPESARRRCSWRSVRSLSTSERRARASSPTRSASAARSRSGGSSARSASSSDRTDASSSRAVSSWRSRSWSLAELVPEGGDLLLVLRAQGQEGGALLLVPRALRLRSLEASQGALGLFDLAGPPFAERQDLALEVRQAPTAGLGRLLGDRLARVLGADCERVLAMLAGDGPAEVDGSDAELASAARAGDRGVLRHRRVFRVGDERTPTAARNDAGGRRPSKGLYEHEGRQANLVTPGLATSTGGASPQAYRAGARLCLEFIAISQVIVWPV